VSFLLDTTAVSEWMKPSPNPGVIRWLDEVDEDRVYLSVMTLAELRYGAWPQARANHVSKPGSERNSLCALRAASSTSKPPSRTLGDGS